MVTFWVFLGCWCWRVGGMVGPFSGKWRRLVETGNAASNVSLLSGASESAPSRSHSIVTILSVAGLTMVLQTAQV
ncbi:hypothetical protein BC826DRAFT_1060000, partial [Russula brevipes]